MTDDRTPAESEPNPASSWAAPSGERPVPPAQPAAAPAAAVAAPPPPGRRPGLPLPAILGIVGGAVLLLVLVVIVGGIALIAASRSGSGGGGTPAAAGPQSVVRSYLTAIAAGKASTARRYLTGDEAESPMLTDAVLQQSRSIAPISGIRVGKPTGGGSTADVPVRYRLGTRTVSASFHLYQQDTGYIITSGLVQLPGAPLKGLDVTVNGVRTTMPDDGLQVFPGAYRVALASPALALTGDGRVDLTSPDQFLRYDALKPELSDEGLATFRRLVKASVKHCLAQRTLSAGCGLSIKSPLRDGVRFDQGSVRRSSTPEMTAKIAHLEPTSTLDTPSLMSAGVFKSPDVKATGSKNGAHGSFSLLFGPVLGTAYVDMSAKDPQVSWR
ncbi:hypothetical protein GCM10025783_08780 [Amnibacterium soli]|uniref:DUF2993 domain-containing protein n=1 Tax=Amnibacterium soli TaxID=1282736 RepID=A0ABP8YXT6_9MICO